MARSVRDVLEENIETMGLEAEGTKSIAAIYARKSLEDAESLEIQISMLKEFVHESENLFLYKIYSDNGFTGTNFERPAFSKMMEDMEHGKFNTIVVKDGSRLGRNYLEAGLYMESIFPGLNVRFISINDHYDSADMACNKDGISLPLKNIMNEQYSKDLSRKLTSAFRVRQMEGKFIGGFTTYGYIKDPNDKNKLVVDVEIAPIIRRIFQSKVDGMSDGAIANELNDESVLSPFAYRYTKGFVRAEKYKSMPWKRGTIAQIITNPMYLGHMVQGRNRQSLSMHEEKHRPPENEWIVVENTHEAIVDDSVFQTVQEIVHNRKKKYNTQRPVSSEETVNFLRGKVFCADCGRAMEIGKSTSKSAIHRYYRCKLYNETAGRSCSLKSVKKEYIEQFVFDTIKYHMKLFSNAESIIRKMNQTEKSRRTEEEYLKKITQAQEERLKISKLAGGLYEDYEQKILNEEEYVFIKEEYDRQMKALTTQIDELKRYTETFKVDYTLNKELNQKVKTYVQCKQLNRKMVEVFISQIKVTDETHIEIIMDCKDQIEKALKIVEKRRLDLHEDHQ